MKMKSANQLAGGEKMDVVNVLMGSPEAIIEPALIGKIAQL